MHSGAVLERIARYRWWILVAWVALWSARFGTGAGYSWHYFVTGSRVLFSAHGLHLFAHHPELQIGPLTLLVTAPVALSVPASIGKIIAMVLVTAVGLLVLHQVSSMSPGVAGSIRSRHRLLMAGLLFLPVWAELAVGWVHPDDALALLFGVLALQLVRSGHPLWSAACLAAATDCKPWAISFAAILLIAPRSRWLTAGAVWLTGILVVWLPFYLADRQTLSAGRFQISNSLSSSLRVFGVHAAKTPRWCRPAQIVVGLALALTLVRRHRVTGVVLAVVAARLLLDPATKGYYDAGLLTGTLIWDLVATDTVIPWLSLFAVAFFYAPTPLLSGVPSLLGLLRTAVLLVIVLAVLLLPAKGLAGPALIPGRPSGPRHLASPKRR